MPDKKMYRQMKQSSFNKKNSNFLLIIVLFLILLVLTSCKNNIVHDDNKNMQDVKISSIDCQELERKLQSPDDFVFIIAKTNCTYCGELINMLKNTDKKANKEFYYLEYDKDNRDSVLTMVENKLNKITSVPTIFIIQNGKIINEMNGYTDEDKFWTFINEN